MKVELNELNELNQLKQLISQILSPHVDNRYGLRNQLVDQILAAFIRACPEHVEGAANEAPD